MHDFSQWLQSAGGTDDVCVLLIVGAILCIAVVFMTESVIPILLAFGCLFLSFGLSSPSLESEIEQIWGLQEVSSECDLPDHDLPTKNMKCYVTNGKGHKELNINPRIKGRHQTRPVRHGRQGTETDGKGIVH